MVRVNSVYDSVLLNIHEKLVDEGDITSQTDVSEEYPVNVAEQVNLIFM